MSERWTAAELKEFYRTGREPVRQSVPQEEIERRYAEAVKRGEVMALDICQEPDGSISVSYAGKVSPEEIRRVAAQKNYAAQLEMLGYAPDGNPLPEKKKRKYGNHVCYEGWKKFDSEKERQFYLELMLRVKAGELKCVLRQVPFDLAEKERLQYFADFVAILPDNTIEAVYDVKSEPTRKNKEYIIKKKLMSELWGIEIREV